MDDTIHSINEPLLVDINLDELEARLSIELLEDRLELGCWVQCNGLCIET